MFGWLKNLFRSRQPENRIETCAQEVLVFMRTVTSQVDQRDFMIPNHHTLIYCYAFGALGIEAQRHELDQTAQFAALLLLIHNLSDNLEARDVSGLLNNAMAAMQEAEGRQYCAEGAEHYRRWRDGDPAVAGLLGKRLAEREKLVTGENRSSIYL